MSWTMTRTPHRSHPLFRYDCKHIHAGVENTKEALYRPLKNYEFVGPGGPFEIVRDALYSPGWRLRFLSKCYSACHVPLKPFPAIRPKIEYSSGHYKMVDLLPTNNRMDASSILSTHLPDLAGNLINWESPCPGPKPLTRNKFSAGNTELMRIFTNAESV